MAMRNALDVLYLSQEDLLTSGCFDMGAAIDAVERSLVDFHNKRILFPDKIVQIFNDDTQERINCLPATLLDKKICGVKWVSVFPPNPYRFGVQNLTAVIILSEIERGFPLCFMEGTLCSNLRVGAMSGLAAKYLARPDSRSIGFIGAGEQAKMQLVALKHVLPSICECRVAARLADEEQAFIDEMQPLFADMTFCAADTCHQRAMEGADVLVTATSSQAPFLKAAWMKEGVFYSHVGGYEDEFDVARRCEKIVCDDWETVKHRTQTLSRMYREHKLADSDIHADLVEIVMGKKPGRESPTERVYFNAVGLAFADIAIACQMYDTAVRSQAGTRLNLQETMLFRHVDMKKWIHGLTGKVERHADASTEDCVRSGCLVS